MLKKQDYGCQTKEQNSINRSRYLFFAPFIIIAVLMLAFFGVWNTHQVGDDYSAYKMEEWIRSGHPEGEIAYSRLLTVSNLTHWTPISNLVLCHTLRDDRLIRIVTVNLGLVFVVSILVGSFSIVLGAHLWSAIFASAWIATSQVLVFSIASNWGPANIMPSLFTVGSTWILWRWSRNLIFENRTRVGYWWFLLAFTGLYILAIMSKETGIRGIALAVGICIIILKYRYDLRYWKKMVGLIVFITAFTVLYFSLRYFFTQADIPLIRSSVVSIEDYSYPRIIFSTMLKNAITILLASLNPVNSYTIYLNIINGSHLKVLLLLFPAIIWGLILCIGWIKLFMASTKKHKFNLCFIALMVICSLFPEIFLGKVSEIYAMASLCPLGILSAIVLSNIVLRGQYWQYILIILAVLFIILNIFSARAKVREIVTTGQYAHSIRQSMKELTDDLPTGAKIAVLHKPRPKEAFGRFGVRGIQANGGLYLRGSRHVWVSFHNYESIKNLQDFDLILKESNDQRVLQVVIPDKM